MQCAAGLFSKPFAEQRGFDADGLMSARHCVHLASIG
jgi:hypothetical protein